MAIKVVEVSQVSPSEGAAQQQLLPLLNFDIVRLNKQLLHFLFFYTFECSESHFLSDIVPALKTSLSLTLKHFLPLSGKIVFPLTSGMPVSRYVAGEDAVSLRIAVSDADLKHLTGSDPTDADKYPDFVQLRLLSTCSSDAIRFSCLAVQATLFPNQGVCIGQTIHHAVADGSTLLGFQQAWASINKFNGDTHCRKFLPSYGRSRVADNLATRAWKHSKMSRPTVSSFISLPTNVVCAKLGVSVAEIRKLKKSVLMRKQGRPHISSLVAVMGLVWSCFAKTAGEEVGDDESEYLTFSVNCRERLSPPLPRAYFGNCVVLVLAESTHGRLTGKEGSVAAALAIDEALQKLLNNKGSGFDDLEIRLKVRGKRVVAIAGSPHFDYYGLDYGWGRVQNVEYLSNDRTVFVSKPREKGGIELSLCVAKVKMDAFAAFIIQGITESLPMKSSL